MFAVELYLKDSNIMHVDVCCLFGYAHSSQAAEQRAVPMVVLWGNLQYVVLACVGKPAGT
jgi:hypothetical protein